jgi:uncharacterized protein (DUF302 family)
MLCSLTVQAAPIVPQHIDEAWVFAVKGKTYDQAREDLVAAIEDRGMVISDVSHVKDMLDRTNADLGYTDSVFDTGAETLLFCKSDLSQKMMRENPHHIAFCPYSISIYTIKSAPNTVFLSYKNPPKMKIYKPVSKLLDSIIQSAAE